MRCWARSGLVLVVLAAAADGYRPAHADIQAALWTGRIDTTTPGGGMYRTWSSSAINGSVLSRLDENQSVGTSHWINHGSGSAPAGSKGVAATWYVDASNNYYEWVIYVATDGKLNIGEVLNGGPISWTSVIPPSGRTLTGHIAATITLQGTNRYMFVGATTTDGHLYRFVAGVLPNLVGGWTDSSAGLTWLSNNPLGVSNNPAGTISSVFAAHTSGAEKLGMVRWDGTTSTWSTTNLGAPSGRRACHSIASAQMSPSGLSGDERVVVACTPNDSIGGIDLAIATAYTSTTFTWSTYDTSTFYQTVTAVTRPTSLIHNTKAIDTYGAELFTGLMIKGVYNGSSYTVTNMGTTGDVASGPVGGMGAVPYGTTSRAFFVSNQDGRNYLYERYGGSTSSAPQNYRAFGDENWYALPGGTIDHYAEGKVSTWQGTMAASVINRPGTGGANDFPQIFFLYSPDEGKTNESSQQISNVVDGVTYNYVSDPTAVVTSQRKMYSFQLGLVIDTCASTHSISRESVYFVTTTPSTFPTFSAPVQLKTVVGGLSLDHPYSAVQHRSGGQPDLIHVAWQNIGTGTIQYTGMADGFNPITPVDLSTSGNLNPPRVTASNSGRVIVYYPLAGSPHTVAFCELYDTNSDGIPDSCCINGTTCGPSAGWQVVDPGPVLPDGSYTLAWSTRVGLGPIVSGSTYIQDEYPVFMAISETGDTLYYCFDHLESSGAGAGVKADAFCTIGTRNPSTGIYSWNTNPVAVAGVSNDSKDQFMPEVVLTQESGTYSTANETAIVTFYDRTDDPANYYYKVKKAVSTTRMASMFPPRAMFGGITSDPEYLPRHCFHQNARFIGDYAGSEGYNVHAQSISVTVPTAGTIGTAIYTNFHALGGWEN